MRNRILIPAFILVFAGLAFSQAEPKAIKFAEFGPMSQAGVKAKVDAFVLELRNQPSAQGYVILYGTPKAIRARRKQITNSMSFLYQDPSRITFVDVKSEKKVRTVMWIVPAGAKPPTP
jgi:hypothetical protein